MFIDFIAVGLIILAFIKGFQKGLIVAIFSLLAFIIGLAAAIKLSSAVAVYLGTNTNISHRWLPVIAFAFVFFIVALLVRLGAKLIERGLRMVMLGWANKLGGIIFYLMLYLFVFSTILFYATQLHLIKPETIQTSTTYPIIYPLAPVLLDTVGTIVPFFKNMFGELEIFFDNVSKKAY